MINNNIEDDTSWFKHMIIKTILSLVILGGTAWGAFINNKITKMEDVHLDLVARLARMEQKLDDIGIVLNDKRKH